MNLQKYENQQLQTYSPNQSEWQLMREQAEILLKSQFLPTSIKTPEQAITIMMTARELNIPPMAAFSTIHVIQQKPTVSPQLMLALINRSGQLENIEFQQNPNSVSVVMKRKGRSPHTETFSKTDAENLGLLGKDNWKKQPETMMKWRVVAACARVVFPDIVLGFYTPDEMGAETNNDGDVVEQNLAPVREFPKHEQVIEAEVIELTPEEEAASESLRQQLTELLPKVDCTDTKRAATVAKFDRLTTIGEKEDLVATVRQKVEASEREANLEIIKGVIFSDDWGYDENGTERYLGNFGVQAIDEATNEQLTNIIKDLKDSGLIQQT